jgi:hypothetical protein
MLTYVHQDQFHIMSTLNYISTITSTVLSYKRYLAKQGILSLSTVRSNRVLHCAMVSDTDLKKGRSSYNKKVAVNDDAEVTHVRWYYNKSVNLLSMFVVLNHSLQSQGGTERRMNIVEYLAPSWCKNTTNTWGE